MRGTDGPASVQRPRNARADRYRDGASKDADAPVFGASDPALPGRPATSGPFRRNPGHAPFGAPSPSFGGRRRRRTTGEPPRPATEQGPLPLGCLTIEYVL